MTITLKNFLNLISDEDVMLELEIDEPYEDDYIYHNFWLSDFKNDKELIQYLNYKVTNISFCTEFSDSELSISITQ